MIKQIKKYSKTISLVIFFFLGFLISDLLGITKEAIVFLGLIFIYLDKYYSRKLNAFKILNAIFLFAIFFGATSFLKSNNVIIWYTPVIIFAILANILFNDLHLGLIMSLGMGIAASNTLENTILFTITGITANILANKGISLKQIMRAAFLAGLIQMLTLVLINHLSFNKVFLTEYFHIIINGIFSGMFILGLSAFGILHIFERIFGVITNLSLLELSDYNHPLLKKLSLIAPGTYHHSLIVGNLSDAAAEKIGANPLLSRVGAYFHDIGKLEKPEYFSENQIQINSKHEGLSPSISKMVITNHIKEGADLAKQYKLNKKIIDFILEHHGTSLVFYFYMRALEEQNGSKPEEEEFRYPGPKPQSKQTAIVLLADSVEAATRSLEDPTPAKIEEITHKIINNRFIDGQLDECNLTLKNLEEISVVFTRMLTSIYHSRIQYPEEKANANHKKSTEKNTASNK